MIRKGSTFNVRRTTCDVRRATFNVQTSEFDGRHSLCRARGTTWYRACRVFSLVLCFLPLVLYAAESKLDEDVRAIAAQLRCPVCQNLSVGDSPSELAREMRALIREQLEQGKTPAQVFDYFVARYGEWVLLAPPKRGLNLIIWLLPVVLIPAGLVMAYLGARRWVRRGAVVTPSPAADPRYAARLQRELDTYE